MSTAGFLVEALVPCVGVAALNASNGDPSCSGLGTATIGTDSRYKDSLTVDPAAVAAHGNRLGLELAALVEGGAVRVSRGGVVLTAAALGAFTTVAGADEPVRISQTPHNNWESISGTWTESYNDTTHLYRVVRTAATAAEKATLDISSQQLRDLTSAGFKPTGFELIYQVATEVANDVNVAVFKTTTPANGVAMAAVALSTGQTYDTSHDTAAERGAIALHTMTITFDPALAAVAALNDGEGVHAELTVTDTTGGAAVFTLWGWSLIGTSRL